MLSYLNNMTKNIWLSITTIALIVLIVLCVYYECGITTKKPPQTSIQEVVDEMFDDIGKAKAEKLVEVPVKKQTQKAPTKPNDIDTIHNKSLNFKSNSTSIENTTMLDIVVEILNKDTSISLTVIGHTDSDGSIKYNQTLGQKRADTIKNYLVHKGISKSRIAATSQGELSPVVENDTTENKAKNRRVELEGTKI